MFFLSRFLKPSPFVLDFKTEFVSLNIFQSFLNCSLACLILKFSWLFELLVSYNALHDFSTILGRFDKSPNVPTSSHKRFSELFAGNVLCCVWIRLKH